MEAISLTDRFTEPNNELIFSVIGDKKIFWQRIMRYLHENYPDVLEVWRFYDDGKCWLFRTIRKKKTIFWIGVYDHNFRVTFYLSDRAIPLIAQSDLPEQIKSVYANTESNKMGRSITIIVDADQDVESVIKLIEVKLKLK